MVSRRDCMSNGFAMLLYSVPVCTWASVCGTPTIVGEFTGVAPVPRETWIAVRTAGSSVQLPPAHAYGDMRPYP